MMNRVHEEWDRLLVPSGHGSNVHYRIFYGSVNWDRSNDGMKAALMVVMQYGSTVDWAQAKAQGEIDFGMPAHILREDLPHVLEAVASISASNGANT